MKRGSIADLEDRLRRALETAHRLDGKAQSLPARGSQYRALARKARRYAAELERRIDIMQRHKDDEVATLLTPPGPVEDWKLVFTETTTIGGVTHRRGSEADASVVAELSRSLNGAFILAKRTKWVPRHTPVIAPKQPTVPKPMDVPKQNIYPEAVMVARRAIRDKARERNIDERSALDLIDPAVLSKALAVGSTIRRQVRLGPFGGGGGNLQTVGEGLGAHRRPIDDVIDQMLLGPLPQEATA
jgi:hypothetical protein